MIRRLQKLRVSKYKIPKKIEYSFKDIDNLYWNMWSQFGFKKGVITNALNFEYAWSRKQRKEFYSIAYHKEVYDKMIKSKKLTTTWRKKCEPILIDK